MRVSAFAAFLTAAAVGPVADAAAVGAAAVADAGAAAAPRGSGSAPALADGGGACSSPSECFWNGACTAGACACFDAWTGAACATLREGPTVQLWPNPSLPLPPDERITDSWGVTLASDPVTGAWTGYFCVACLYSAAGPQPFSMHNSGIIQASAPSLEGPFTFESVFSGIFSEGPHMTRAPDGSFLMITPGNSSNGAPVTCTGDYRASAARAAPLPTLGNVVNKTLWSSASPAGPWAVHNFSLAETQDLAYFSNPSMTVDPQTSQAFLAWRVNLVAPVGRGETIGIASASAWDASRYTAIAEPLQKGLVGVEDPFLVRAHLHLL